MATQGFVQLPTDASNTGKKEDHVITDNSQYREVVTIGGPQVDAQLAPVSATNGLAVDVKTLAPDAATQTTLALVNTNAGATTDAAVVGDNNGSLSAKLRGLSKILNDVWSSASHYLQVQIQNATLAVTQSGTWTVQPGNTANTTAWKVDGSAVTQPISIADGSDSTLGAKADAKSTATDTTAVSIMSVLKEISAMEQAPASRAVTNAGTFATQAAQSGTWTVQPGNTANTTAWKVDGSAVTQPISAASLPLPASASAKVAMSVTALQVTASGDTTLVASGTHKIKRVEASNSHATTALTVGIKVASQNGGAVFGKKYLPAAGGLAVWVFPDDFLQVTSEAITANLSAAGQVEFTAYYE